MTFFLWYLIASSILGIGFGYLGWRLISISPIPRRWKRIGWSAVGVLFLFLLLSIVLQTRGVEDRTGIAAWIAYGMLGFGSSVLTLVVVRDILWLLGKTGARVRILWNRIARKSNEPQPVDEERRRLLLNTVNLGIMGVAGVLTTYGIYEARRRPAILTVDILIPNLHPDLEGFRIAQLTDIHAGLTVRKGFVETVAEMTDQLKCDLIAFTGDLVDGSVANLRNDVSPMEALRAPFGQFFIT